MSALAIVFGLAIAIFIAAFAIATLRNIHLGALMRPAACVVGVVGVWLADKGSMSTEDVVSKFPVNVFILIAGVTFLFGRAHPLALTNSARFLRLLNEHASPVTIRSKATTTIQPNVLSWEQIRMALASFPRNVKE